MSLKVNREQGLVGTQGHSSEASSSTKLGLVNKEYLLKGFAKYKANQGENRLWKADTSEVPEIRVAQGIVTGVGTAAKLGKEHFDREMAKHKDKVEKAEKQNRETNNNVEHIKQDLDRASREMARDKENKQDTKR